MPGTQCSDTCITTRPGCVETGAAGTHGRQPARTGNTARRRIAGALAVLPLLLLPACGGPSGVPVESLATAGQPRGVVYISLAGFCSWGSAGLSIAYWEPGGGVDVQYASAGKEITVSRPASGLASLIVSEVKDQTKVFRYELPPGNYTIRRMSCETFGNPRRVRTFSVEDSNKSFTERLQTGAMPNDRRIGLGFFTVKPNEVISAGSLDSESDPSLRLPPDAPIAIGTLKARPFTESEMQFVRQAYPDEARKIAYRPAKALTGR
jgi:hypothetical protein